MRISRYLEAKSFLDEAKKLKVVSGHLDVRILERLEQQGSLYPRLRLRYPDEIERRWWAENHEGYIVSGPLEPDGPRWDAACALEKQRQRVRWREDPTLSPHPLDDPEPRFAQFIQRPAGRPFIPWQDFDVSLGTHASTPSSTSDTVVAYYSAWQLLQFAEVANMGIMSHLNLLNSAGWPPEGDVASAPRTMSLLPLHAVRGLNEHAPALDAIVWFAEEAHLGALFATREDYGRRFLGDSERTEIIRTRKWAAAQAQARHSIGPGELLGANRFLFEQWAHWEHEGRPLISSAYKAIAAHGVRLACLASGQTVDEYRQTVGHAGGYFKPIMDVIWPDWAKEQRDDVRQILTSFRSPTSLLKADFSDDLIDRFLDFIDQQQLHGFYWRLDSFHRHSFKGNDYSLEGLKGDVQGMAVVLEHIAAALGAKKEQLRDKFKELWAGDPDVLKLLKTNSVMKVGNAKSIDLDWFESRNGLSLPEQTAADLAIVYAIRGGAHRVISETNSLKLERMMLIMLRAIVKTFGAVHP